MGRTAAVLAALLVSAAARDAGADGAERERVVRCPLVVVACNYAYWSCSDGAWARATSWDVCRRPPVTRAATVVDAVLSKRRPRPVRWDLPTHAEGLRRRGGIK